MYRKIRISQSAAFIISVFLFRLIFRVRDSMMDTENNPYDKRKHREKGFIHMRKMKAVLVFVLAVSLLWGMAPAMAAGTTEDIDRMFIGSFTGTGVSWERTAYGRGAAADITETARLDGHEYGLRIMSDGTGVAEVSLYGWFEDLRMDDAMFPLGLQALSACVYAVDTLVPTRNASLIISPYDVYDVLQAGMFFDTSGSGGWHVDYINIGRIEASHDCGAHMVMSVNGGTFSFTFTAQ